MKKVILILVVILVSAITWQCQSEDSQIITKTETKVKAKMTLEDNFVLSGSDDWENLKKINKGFRTKVFTDPGDPGDVLPADAVLVAARYTTVCTIVSVWSGTGNTTQRGPGWIVSSFVGGGGSCGNTGTNATSYQTDDWCYSAGAWLSMWSWHASIPEEEQ